ncbi:MAG: GIY-YIG nuclease family protein [Maritimibacter sp.]
MIGRSLQLYFIDGQPDGMLTAELFNWTGHVLHFPRTRLGEALARKEANHTGVYILVGSTEDGPLAYIGEAENLAARIKNHASEKGWWDSATLITTAADSLHKAHVKFLEARLITQAKRAQNTPLENGNQPTGASLSEADAANMETFIENLMIILPAIRIDLFVDKARPSTSPTQPAEKAVPRFSIKRPKIGVDATARLSNGEMVIESGSVVRAKWIGKGSWDSGYRKIREGLIERGVISIEGDLARFTESFAFSSPSAAAAVVLGRASNGRIEWYIEDGSRTYADWEDDQLITIEAQP